MRAVWTIARRELKAMFDQPTGYILVVVFLVLNNFFFFRSALVTQSASLRPMLDLLPWLFLFFVPAVTMRSLAEDTGRGTHEVVLAQPVSEFEYLMGKYLGLVLFIWIALGLTLAVPASLSVAADLQVGVVVAQYLGSMLFAGGLAAVGIWTSSMTRNQITAFIIGTAVMFLLVLIGLDPLLVGLPTALGAAAANLGVLPHFANIGRGVIDLRDVVYFVTLAAVFLSLTYLVLVGRKLSRKGDAISRLRLGVAMLVAAFIVVNLFGRHIGGRLDLTPGKSYTLSDATRQLVSNLDDIVTIKLFASSELPAEVALRKRDIDDMLSDYRTAGGGNIRFEEIDPSDDEDARDEARSLGIPAVQFNVVGQGELSVTNGYLGLSVQYADGSEAIPFVQRTDDLEYRLTSFIRGLTRTEVPRIGFAQSPQPLMSAGFGAVREALGQSYEIVNVPLPTDSAIDPSLRVLIIAGDYPGITEAQVDVLDNYIKGGGSIFLFASGMTPNPQQPLAQPNPVGLNALIRRYGVIVRPDMVYDLLQNERLSQPTQGGMRVAVVYPFWVRATSTGASVVNQDVNGLWLPWPSSVDTSTAAQGTVTPLLVTSSAAGREIDAAIIQPGREFPRENLRQRLLGVQIDPSAGEGAEQGVGRFVIVGSHNFLGDEYARAAQQNMVFALNAVDWLAQDQALIEIRSKNRQPPQLIFESETTANLVQYGNIGGVPALLVLFAIVRLLRRRRLTTRVYGEAKEEE